MLQPDNSLLLDWGHHKGLNGLNDPQPLTRASIFDVVALELVCLAELGVVGPTQTDALDLLLESRADQGEVQFEMVEPDQIA